MPIFTAALGFDLADRFNSAKPNLKDLSLTEITMLRKTQLRHPPSKTDRRNLGIFEHQGLLYVKGRLGNIKMRPSALTPLYLPKEAMETALIIMDYHRNNCHSGVQASLANIRMKYWFTSGRRTVQRAIYKHCFPCRREVLHPYASPPWPQLPTTRVTQARPFFCTGLDFFGPCLLRAPHPNGGYELRKYYVAIFVCMTYRCVHLELCSDLSTEQFLHALRRFGSRREYPARILSDNGQSFLTARQIINQIHQSRAPARPPQRRNPIRQAVVSRMSSRRNPAHSVGPSNAQNPPPPTQPTLTPEEETLIDFCQRHKIEWQTITELSPWRGGVYERLIGLIKHCLRRSIGRSKPTEVEYCSLLAEAERTTNSRPLSFMAEATRISTSSDHWTSSIRSSVKSPSRTLWIRRSKTTATRTTSTSSLPAKTDYMRSSFRGSRSPAEPLTPSGRSSAMATSPTSGIAASTVRTTSSENRPSSSATLSSSRNLTFPAATGVSRSSPSCFPTRTASSARLESALAGPTRNTPGLLNISTPSAMFLACPNATTPPPSSRSSPAPGLIVLIRPPTSRTSSTRNDYRRYPPRQKTAIRNSRTEPDPLRHSSLHYATPSRLVAFSSALPFDVPTLDANITFYTSSSSGPSVVNCEFTRRACEPSSLPLVAAVRPLSVTFRDLECGGHFTTADATFPATIQTQTTAKLGGPSTTACRYLCCCH